MSSEEQLQQVRSVLLAPQSQLIAELKRQIEDLSHRLSNPELRAKDTSEILQLALSKSSEKDNWFACTLKPMVVDNFHQVSRDEPEIMAEALFPILGPALRKMIVNIISPDKNRKKSGYRIEQLFLIEKTTGLPVCHVASRHAETQDADMVSGMLSAIQSFVCDAFQTEEFDGLNTLEIGELAVWIEWGPQAALAAIVRGAPPGKLREALQVKLENIHHDHQDALNDYQGDAEIFAALKPDLYLFLDSHSGSLKSRFNNLSRSAKRNSMIALIGTLALFYVLVRGWIEDSHINNFIARLQSEPGIVVSSHERRDGIHQIYGFRDPLSVQPEEMLSGTNIRRDIEFHLEPYHALLPAFLQHRAILLLMPGSGVDVHVIDNTLYVSGHATPAWIKKAKPMVSAITGVSKVEFNVRTSEDDP